MTWWATVSSQSGMPPREHKPLPALRRITGVVSPLQKCLRRVLLPGNSANNSSNALSSPELQWTSTGIHHNSTHAEDSLSGSSTHPGRNRRPQSRRQPISTNFVEHGAPLGPVSRGNEMCHERAQLLFYSAMSPLSLFSFQGCATAMWPYT